MKSQHTLTTINVQGDDQEAYEVYADESKEQTIAFCFTEANAHLIAKAPEMHEDLAQLRQDKAEMVAVCKRGLSYIQCREGDEPSGLRLITAIEMFETTIAKAGEEL